jgi:hypothetical protein
MFLCPCSPLLHTVLYFLFCWLPPPAWKQAIIHPVYKGGNRHDPNNYRPISLTSIPCKIMEKIINRSLQSFLISNNLLHPAQHGFLPTRSCLSNLTIFLNDLSKAAEVKQKMDCIFFDFSKAFDVIPHNLLMQHLEGLGILGPLCRWLSSFISGRTSRVRVCGSLSSEICVSSGVPQGSVLGPTLFIVFINTLPSIVPPGSRALLFADDLKVWSSDPLSLQKAVDACYLWSQTNRLPFNPRKTEHISFIKPVTVTFTLPTASGPYPIPTVDEHKDLGVWITPDLSPSLMCIQSSKKAIRMAHLLHRTFPLIDQRNFITLYSSLSVLYSNIATSSGSLGSNAMRIYSKTSSVKPQSQFPPFEISHIQRGYHGLTFFPSNTVVSEVVLYSPTASFNLNRSTISSRCPTILISVDTLENFSFNASVAVHAETSSLLLWFHSGINSPNPLYLLLLFMLLKMLSTKPFQFFSFLSPELSTVRPAQPVYISFI